MADNDKLNKAIQQIKQAMQKPFRPDMDFMNAHNQIMANSAYEMQRVQEEMNTQFQEIAERNELRDNAIQRTALESIEHTKLLEKQLQEVQAQNEILRTEAAKNKAEADESRKSAKKARKLNIAAFVLSIAFPIISIVTSILIALYL